MFDPTTVQPRFDAARLDFPARSLAVSPDGALVALSGGDDARVEVRDARTGAVLSSPESTPASDEHIEARDPLRRSRSPRRTVSLSLPKPVRCRRIDARTGETLATMAVPPDLVGPLYEGEGPAGWVGAAHGRRPFGCHVGPRRHDALEPHHGWPGVAGTRVAVMPELHDRGGDGRSDLWREHPSGCARSRDGRDPRPSTTRESRVWSTTSPSATTVGCSQSWAVSTGSARSAMTSARTAAVWRLDGSGPIQRTLGSGPMVIGGYEPAGRLLLTLAPVGPEGPLRRRPLGLGAFTPGAVDQKVLDPDTGAIVDELDEILAATWSGSATRSPRCSPTGPPAATTSRDMPDSGSPNFLMASALSLESSRIRRTVGSSCGTARATSVRQRATDR